MSDGGAGDVAWELAHGCHVPSTCVGACLVFDEGLAIENAEKLGKNYDVYGESMTIGCDLSRATANIPNSCL